MVAAVLLTLLILFEPPNEEMGAHEIGLYFVVFVAFFTGVSEW